MTIVITGADGQLGRALSQHFAARADVMACSRAELDITDAARVREVMDAVRPAAVLNCAAYNDVDGAEDHAAHALEINALAVRTLARASARVGAALVHYSTDFVFDGTASAPYTEDDAPSPRSVYAASKLVGEWMARDAGRWYVCRVESLFGAAHTPGTRRTGSIDRIIESLEQRRPAPVFTDRVVSPSYLPDVAAATGALLERAAPSGLYHVVNDGHCTWHELARRIAARVGGEEVLRPVASTSLQLKAARPRYAALSCRRLADAAFRMPTLDDALERYIGFLRTSRPR